MSGRVQPDPILDNFSHDVYLYGSPEIIVETWRLQGYTHVLVHKRGASFILDSTGESIPFNETLELLKPISISQDGSYELLEIPARSLE
jgi:hypothetical protein